MNEVTLSGFDYSILDVNIADFLKQKEINMKEVVSDAYYQIGKELKEAQAELAGDNQYNGVFQKWYESLGFSKRSVYNYINYHNLLVQQLHDRETIEQLPKKLAYEIAKPSADPELKEKVLDGDITTYKEYQLLLAEKKELEESNEFLQQIRDKLVEEKDKAENEKDGYRQKVDKLKAQIDFLENNPIVPEQIGDRLKELEERAGDLQIHKAEIRNYQEKSRKINEEIAQLLEYQRNLKEENDITAQRAEVVQGLRSEINKLRNGQGRIEELIKKDVDLRDVDLYNVGEMADFLNEIAEKLYNYIASRKSIQKGEFIDVN